MSTDNKIIPVGELSKKVLRKHTDVATDAHSEWKQAQEYEGRLFGGAYGYHRFKSVENRRATPAYKMISQGRERYNALRKKFGYEPIKDWSTRPERHQLVQFMKPPLKEDAGAVMGVGNGDPAHVTNPTDNYSAQRSQRKQSYKKILRRKKPIR